MTASVVQVQNTFVHGSDPQQVLFQSASEPASPTCNRFEARVHALMFRTKPLETWHPVDKSGPNFEELPQHAAMESGLVPCATTASNSAPKTVKRNKDKILKFQTRQRPGALDGRVPALDDLDLKSSISEVTQSDDEVATVSTVSSDAATTVPGVALERKESGDSFDAVSAKLSDENMETLLQRVPRNTKGELLSIGSLAHEDGTCKPCVFAYSDRKTCDNGVRCLFCHFQHVQKKRQRLTKKDRTAAAQSKDSIQSTDC